MQRYQWLLFDADGTLFDFDRAEVLALQEVFRLTGVKFDPAYLSVYQRINHAAWQAVEKGELTVSLLKAHRFEQFLQSIGVAHSPTAFSDCYLDCLAGCSELINDAAEVLQALEGKYRMAILTNGLKAVQRQRLAKSLIGKHFAELIISEEIGVSKPAREFFDITWQRLGNPNRKDALMIGDSWVSDIIGATQYGVDACWYNPGGKPRPAGCDITREIASLRELVDWLG